MLKKGNFEIKLEFKLTDVYPQLPKPTVSLKECMDMYKHTLYKPIK